MTLSKLEFRNLGLRNAEVFTDSQLAQADRFARRGKAAAQFEQTEEAVTDLETLLGVRDELGPRTRAKPRKRLRRPGKRVPVRDRVGEAAD